MREALFNIIANEIVDARFLDLFAGSGAIGLEAASRGAASVTLIENDSTAADAIKNNIMTFGVQDKARLMRSDATKPGPASMPYDIIFADPPYRSGLAEPALRALQAGGWIAESTRVILELSAKEPKPPHEGFIIVDERRYGPGRLIFLNVKEGSQHELPGKSPTITS